MDQVELTPKIVNYIRKYHFNTIWNSLCIISRIWKNSQKKTIIDCLKILAPYNFGWGSVRWFQIFNIWSNHLNWIEIINPCSTIRNSQSKPQITVQIIGAKGRLCLTGTPSQKSLKNWMSLLNFIFLYLKTP